MKLTFAAAACLLAASTFSIPAIAQQGKAPERPSVTAHPTVDSKDKVYPMDQIVTATVHDAWIMSGKNEEAFFDIVEQLAQFSAQKRGVSLPNSEMAGRRLGNIIKTRAKADHDELLYAIVDSAVKSMGTKTVAAAKK